MPAPAVLHPCDVPYHSRHLVTPEAWSGGRKPAHGRRSCRSRDLADPGTAPGRLGSLTPGRRKRRHMARRHIMPYQDAGQQSHQLATWAHSITQGRSPPSRTSLSSDQFTGGFGATDVAVAVAVQHMRIKILRQFWPHFFFSTPPSLLQNALIFNGVQNY